MCPAGVISTRGDVSPIVYIINNYNNTSCWQHCIADDLTARARFISSFKNVDAPLIMSISSRHRATTSRFCVYVPNRNTTSADWRPLWPDKKLPNKDRTSSSKKKKKAGLK